jgi:hypothetical protein
MPWWKKRLARESFRDEGLVKSSDGEPAPIQHPTRTDGMASDPKWVDFTAVGEGGLRTVGIKEETHW